MNWKRYRVVWLLAKRDLLADRKVTLVVVAALSFAFLNLAFFPSFIQGFSGSFVDNIVQTSTGHVQITAEDGRLDDVDSIERTVRSLPGVMSVEKQLRFNADVSTASDSISATVVGLEARDLSVYRSRMQEGRFVDSGSDGEVTLGIFLVEDTTVGDRGLATGVGRQVEMSTANGSKELKVVGTVGRQGPAGANSNAYMSYEDAEELLDADGEASAIKILLDSRDDADDFKTRLQQLNLPGNIRTWEQVSEVGGSINATFGIVTGVVSIVGLIVAVATVGVVVFINVSKRRREIGILRSIGTSRRTVLEVFLLEAVIFGLAGVVIGNIIMISTHAYLTANPIQTPLGPLSTDLTQSLLVTRTSWLLLASLGAGALPAWLASRQEIVEAIENR